MKNSLFIDLKSEIEEHLNFSVSYGNTLDKEQKIQLIASINNH